MNSKLIFTLVIIVLIAIATIVVPPHMPIGVKTTKEQKALISVRVLHKAVVAIENDIGAFPKDSFGLEVIYTNVYKDDKWDGPYYLRKTYTKDSWGNEIIYKYPHECKVRVGSFALYSVGENGIDECMSGDDIFQELE